MGLSLLILFAGSVLIREITVKEMAMALGLPFGILLYRLIFFLSAGLRNLNSRTEQLFSQEGVHANGVSYTSALISLFFRSISRREERCKCELKLGPFFLLRNGLSIRLAFSDRSTAFYLTTSGFVCKLYRQEHVNLDRSIGILVYIWDILCTKKVVGKSKCLLL